MIIETKTDQDTNAVVREVVNQYGAEKAELVPILNEINRRLGYLSSETLQEISILLRTPKSQLFSVATFYNMLSTKKQGKHVIHFCESAPCHVVGGREIWRTLQETLSIEPGDTTPDGKWTLVTTSCLGVCGVGPVIIIDEDIYGNVTPEQVPDILARYS